jgi:hypothetical protein
MLRITLHKDTEPMAMVLEGKLAGDWVHELREEWSRLRPVLQDGTLVVSLTGVSCVDDAGRRLLTEIYIDGALLTGSGLFARTLVGEITESRS